MAWKNEGWADLVARASGAAPRQHDTTEHDRSALAARAQRWVFTEPRVELTGAALMLGAGIGSVEVGLAQVYHVEPVDPWPSIAIGWVDRGEPYRTVLGPRRDADADAFAAAVERIAGESRLARAAAPGWLAVDEIAWERAEAMPGERDEGPAMRGYRTAPEAPDPILATRTTQRGAASLWTWVWARLSPMPRRIDPRELVLTRGFVYARTRGGDVLRIPASALRTGRRTLDRDTILVFGRNTELLLAAQDGCALAAELEARIATDLARSDASLREAAAPQER